MYAANKVEGDSIVMNYVWNVDPVKVTPAKGEMGIFDRSQYEDVLAARVNKLVSEKMWSDRYEEINNFEHLLSRNDTILLQFFLYISNKELERLKQLRNKSWSGSSLT